MGIGKITEAKETTEGALSSSQGGAGAAAEKLASVGDRAGREARQTIGKGLGDAAKNVGDALKVAGDFAVKTLWEKPIAEAEEKIRELDVKCRKEGWRDLHGVERPGFELCRGAEAMDVGERWDAYMARESRKITQELGLSDGQREELSRRTRKLRVETKARLVEFGLNEAMTSNLRDIDIRATRGAERSILDVVDRANADRDVLAKDAAYHSGNAEDGAAVLSRKDDAAAVGLFDALAEKRAGLIRDKVIGGLGRKSEAQATAEADALVRVEALETVKALAAAGHYERARKLVEQGRRAVDDSGARLFDDAALAKGRELVDGMEMSAAVNAANVAISAIRDADGNYPAGRVKAIENAIETVKRVGATQKRKDSHIAAEAAKTAAQFDKAADQIRFAELLVAMDDDAFFRGEGEDPKFPKGSRDARLWPEVKKTWEKSTGVDFATGKRKEAKRAEFMLKAAKYAANNPAQFYLDVVQAERNGELKASDRQELFGFFNKGYVDGFADEFGMKRLPVKQTRAKEIAQVIEDEFGGDFIPYLATDKSGGLAIGPGGLSFSKDAQPDEATWVGKEEFYAPSEYGGRKMTNLAKQSLPANRMIEIANRMLEFSHVNGMKMDYDPVTGEKGEHTVDVVKDLRRYCQRVKGELKAEDTKGKTLEFLRSEAADNLSGTMLNRIRTARDTLLK